MKKQAGNVVLWIILGLVAVGIAVAVVWRYFAATDSLSNAQNAADTSATQATTKPLKVNEYTWQVVTSQTVKLDDWGVKFTIPKAYVGKVAYLADKMSNAYNFASTDVLTPDCDLKYYRQTTVSTPGFEVIQYKGSFSTLFASTDKTQTTYADYYAQHKDPKGNFFVDPMTPNRRIYKVGDYYYHTFQTPENLPVSSQKNAADAAQKQYCGDNVKPLETDTTFLDSLATLQLQ